jgi:predicted O-methyltransferase YrrM/glyoxylase-like metal-dependent hydrolase (beta-lactamase superfamily II)
MDPRWLSNGYLVADREGGSALFVDSGAPIEPLLRAAERWSVTPEAVLRTHSHADHVAYEAELGVPVVTGAGRFGDLQVEAIPTPGHSDDMVCFVIGDLVFSGDTLFKDAVGGGGFEAIKHAVMDVYMAMPHAHRVLPGHTDETTIGREWDENPFIRVWRGIQPEGSEQVKVTGRDATLIVWSPDYDGKGKAWVRFDDGTDAIVPRIQEYVEQFTTPHDPFLAHVDEVTRDELGHPSMLTGPVAGRFLELLTWFGQPKRVLEIGTFSGHSALAMAAALPDGGHIDTCELDEEHAAVAQRHFDESPYGSRITLHLGPALDSIAALDGDFDFVFIDADKEGYVDYYEATLPRLTERGLIVADNTLAAGRVISEHPPIATFNEHVAADPRSVQVLLSVRDGMTLIRHA